MADEALKWLMAFEDKVSGPAKTAESNLAKLEARLLALQKAEKETSDPAMKKRLASRLSGLGIQKIEALAAVGAEKHAEQTGRWVELLDHGLGAYGKISGLLGTVVSAVSAVAQGVAGVVYQFGRMGVEAAAAKEEQVAVFRGLLGSQEAAESMVDSFDRLAAKSKFTADQTSEIGRKLIAGGFATEDVPTYIRALSDAAAATGATSEKVDGAVEAMLRVNATGKLTEKTLFAMSQAGVPVSQVYKMLGEDLGVTADAARDLARKGKINANEGLWAVVGGVARGRAGGNLGAEGKRYAEETYAGLKKNFADFKSQIFDDLFAGGGHGAFKGFWKNVNSALNPDSPSGRRVRAVISDSFNRLFSTIFGPLNGDTGLDRIEKVFTSVTRALEFAVQAGRALWAVLEGMVTGSLDAMGLSADNLLGAGGALDPKNMEKVVAGAKKLGEAIGYVAGKALNALDSISGWTRNIELSVSLADKLAGWAGVGGQKGPSAEYEAKRAILEQEYAAARERAGLAPRASTTAAAAAGARGSATSNVTQNLTFNGPADPAVVREAAKGGARDGVTYASEDLAFAMGGIDE